MRVLYSIVHPVTYSETYIRAEIDWMVDHGVEVSFWAQTERLCPGYPLPERLIISANVEEAIERFKPDLIHAHKIPFARAALAGANAHSIPLTVRGHSIDFSVPELQELPDAARIWLFPTMARWCDQANVEALPVAFDPQEFYPAEPDPQRYVVRAAQCKPGKDVEGFIRIARLCPDVRFTLIATSVGPTDAFIDYVQRAAPPNVLVLRHLDNEVTAEIVRRAWVCLRSHDPDGHTYGMPISIAESMSAGLPVIVRATSPDDAASTGAEDYVGDAGFVYTDHEAGAQLIQRIMSWTPEERRAAQVRSTARAQRFRADVVLPRMLRVWGDLTR